MPDLRVAIRGLCPPLRSRSYIHVVEEFVIAFRPEDERGRAIVEALEDLADITLRQVLQARRYGLIRRGADIGSIDSELERIDPSWHEHIKLYREAVIERS
jgi:hypothetical protein